LFGLYDDVDVAELLAALRQVITASQKQNICVSSGMVLEQ